MSRSISSRLEAKSDGHVEGSPIENTPGEVKRYKTTPEEKGETFYEMRMSREFKETGHKGT